MTEARYKVLVLTRYGRKGASSRIRHFDLIPGLREAGFACDVQSLMDDEAMDRFYAGLPRRKLPLLQAYLSRLRLLSQRGYDLIWIEKEAFPWLPWALERIAFGRPGCATVVDYDDIWPDRYAQHSRGIIRRMGRVRFPRLLQAADAVTAANPVLTRALERVGARQIDTIYNAIDLDRYARAGRIQEGGDRPSSPPADPVRVGWIGTPFTANEHLTAVAPLLNRLQSEGLIEILLVGAGDAVPELRAQRLRWSEESEAEDVARMDVGIMPLGNNIFDNGKSGWKLVQYMAAGRPVVASAVGFNTMLVEDGVTGFLVNDVQSLEARLRQLAGDPALRQRMGAAGQASLAKHYGMTQTLSRTVSVFEDALARARERSGSGAAAS